MAGDSRMSGRVLLVEDHTATALGVRMLIAKRPEYELVGSVPDGESALELIAKEHPDVVCADLTLQGEMSGIDLCTILNRWPHPPAVVLHTAREDIGVVAGARSAGASGVVAKRDPVLELDAAMQTALGNGAFYMSPVLRGIDDASRLSAKQRDVLRLMADGLENVEIAERLQLGLETIKTHVRAVLKKLGAAHRTEAVAKALRYKLID